MKIPQIPEKDGTPCRNWPCGTRFRKSKQWNWPLPWV